mgnify:CR=1 FL=1
MNREKHLKLAHIDCILSLTGTEVTLKILDQSQLRFKYNKEGYINFMDTSFPDGSSVGRPFLYRKYLDCESEIMITLAGEEVEEFPVSATIWVPSFSEADALYFEYIWQIREWNKWMKYTVKRLEQVYKGYTHTTIEFRKIGTSEYRRLAGAL